MKVNHWLAEQPELAEHLLFQTSGSMGAPKYVCLSKQAMRASAAMVNAHLESDATDVWLGALPRHHIGGHSVHERAEMSGARVASMEGKWDPQAFCELASQKQASLSALVPTQVYDLVTGEHRAPESMRAILVGGGALAINLARQAEALGWPLLQTYGMTETASQVATQPLGSDPDAPMVILPGWNAELNSDGHLRLEGEALFSGYVIATESSFGFTRQDGWFTTSDRVALDGRSLTFLGRSTDRLKIKGELVSLSKLRAQLDSAAIACDLPPASATLVAIDDPRDEKALLLVTDTSMSTAEQAQLLDAYRVQTMSLVHPKGVAALDQLPRTALNKLDEAALQVAVAALTPRDCPS